MFSSDPKLTQRQKTSGPKKNIKPTQLVSRFDTTKVPPKGTTKLQERYSGNDSNPNKSRIQNPNRSNQSLQQYYADTSSVNVAKNRGLFWQNPHPTRNFEKNFIHEDAYWLHEFSFPKNSHFHSRKIDTNPLNHVNERKNTTNFGHKHDVNFMTSLEKISSKRKKGEK